jgi:hypothetical protein
VKSPSSLTSERILADAFTSSENSRWSPAKKRGKGEATTNISPFITQAEFGIKALSQKLIESNCMDYDGF